MIDPVDARFGTEVKFRGKFVASLASGPSPYFARPDSSVFSIRTVAAGYIIKIVRLARCASASLVNRSDTMRTLGTPGANTR
jgi:hypothetical protein